MLAWKCLHSFSVYSLIIRFKFCVNFPPTWTQQMLRQKERLSNLIIRDFRCWPVKANVFENTKVWKGFNVFSRHVKFWETTGTVNEACCWTWVVNLILGVAVRSWHRCQLRREVFWKSRTGPDMRITVSSPRIVIVGLQDNAAREYWKRPLSQPILTSMEKI